MGLQSTKYEVSCDVLGCNNAAEYDSLDTLNRHGWQAILVYEGKRICEQIHHSQSRPIICPDCIAAGNFKTMQIEYLQ